MSGPAPENKVRLWTSAFIRICLINLLIFVAFHMLMATFAYYVIDIGGTEVTAGFIAGLFAVSAVLILYSVVGYWNMWYEPMIFINKRNMYPLQSVLRQILIDEDQSMMGMGGKTRVHMLSGNNASSVGILIKYANIVITTLPILCAYPFAQKYFVKGVLLGSVKG